MSGQSSTQVVSANELLGGAVVYFTRDEGWSERLSDARVAQDEGAGAALLEAAQRYPGEVVGPYLVPVNVDEHGIASPVHIREVIRVIGPTVARQHAAAI